MTITLIVLDSVGLGFLPDAHNFNDEGADTLDHCLLQSGVKLPNFSALGLGNIQGVHSLARVDKPLASFGRFKEKSLGKDTTTGHWEFMGIILEHPFKTFPPDYPSFPQRVMDAFDKATGRGHLGNYAASGTVIIDELGEEHLKTAKPIVYTSADSVFQIAAHVDIVPLETLYAWCEAAREILQGDDAVARVIARPFEGTVGNFKRLGSARHDYSLTPPFNILNRLYDEGKEVISIGKIADIYNDCAFTQKVKSQNNLDGIEQCLKLMQERPDGLIFCNLVEFDSLYGHRRDVEGYARALAETDERLPELLAAVGPHDYLIFVSDHGNDPTWFGTDHTREYGLLLVYQPQTEAKDLGTRESFADLGASVADLLGIDWLGAGKSFKELLGLE
ncbi:MAG: phosphopentomutase [Deinococcales bacterium]